MSILPDVVIGWEVTEYTVAEGVNQTAELCAVISGELTFELPAVVISTTDGTATSSASGKQSTQYAIPWDITKRPD